MTRSRFALLVVSASVAVAGCDAVAGGSAGNPIGVGSVSARSKDGGYTTAPALAFYRVTGATFVSAQVSRDTCVLANYSATSGGGTTTAPALSAGTAIAVTIGTRTDSLKRVVGSADNAYRTSLTSGIPYAPGDSLVITISGDPNGFPNSVFRGRTAEPFVINPITPPTAENTPIPVTWTPSTDANSAMFINLRFGASGSTTLNRQIACTFFDDGSATIPGTVTTEWIQAATRDYVGQRIRTILTTIPVPLSYFNIVSSFSWPTPVSP
jgi:hypothetical protein